MTFQKQMVQSPRDLEATLSPFYVELITNAERLEERLNKLPHLSEVIALRASTRSSGADGRVRWLE